MVKKLVTCYKGFSSFQFGGAAATFSLDVVTAQIIQTNFLRQRSQRRLGINYAWSLHFVLRIWKNKLKRQKHAENKYEIEDAFQHHQHQHGNPVPVGMGESGPHKHSILRNKEVPKKNAPHKLRDVTRPTVMVKRYGFRGTLPIKYKNDFSGTIR